MGTFRVEIMVATTAAAVAVQGASGARARTLQAAVNSFRAKLETDSSFKSNLKAEVETAVVAESGAASFDAAAFESFDVVAVTQAAVISMDDDGELEAVYGSSGGDRP